MFLMIELRDKKAQIVGGFTVDFWAIIAIFIILALYIATSFILKSLNGGGNVILESESTQSKILQQLERQDFYLDLLIDTKKDFRGQVRDFPFVLKSFSEESSSLTSEKIQDYLSFFSAFGQIPYLEINNGDKYIFCSPYPSTSCLFGNPESDKTRSLMPKADLFGIYEFNMYKTRIILSNLNLYFENFRNPDVGSADYPIGP